MERALKSAKKYPSYRKAKIYELLRYVVAEDNKNLLTNHHA